MILYNDISNFSPKKEIPYNDKDCQTMLLNIP